MCRLTQYNFSQYAATICTTSVYNSPCKISLPNKWPIMNNNIIIHLILLYFDHLAIIYKIFFNDVHAFFDHDRYDGHNLILIFFNAKECVGMIISHAPFFW